MDYDYSARALELADEIIGMTSDLQRVLLQQAEELRAKSARRVFAILPGGDSPIPLENFQAAPEGGGIGCE